MSFSVPTPLKTSAASTAILLGFAAMAMLGIWGFLYNTKPPDSAYRCQQKGTHFVAEMRKRQIEAGVSLERRAYTYRAHFNSVENKCFVRTDTTSVTEDGPTIKRLSEVWDVDASAGAEPYATKGWSYAGFDELTAYSSHHWPKTMPAEQWFDSLMAQ